MRVCGPSESGEGDTSDLHAYHSMRVPEVVSKSSSEVELLEGVWQVQKRQ